MKRIFPAHAYGPGPRTACFWASTVPAPDFPVAEGDIACDVAVIGAGFTGLSAALHLAEAGEDVRVLEAETVGWGASGRNGGFCCLGGSAASDAMLRRAHGEDARREWRRAEIAAVETVRDLIVRHGIEADTHSEGETVLAHTARAAAGFPDRAARIEADYGITPTSSPARSWRRPGCAAPSMPRSPRPSASRSTR